MGIRRPAVEGAPVFWAASGLECWDVNAQFSGILKLRQ